MLAWGVFARPCWGGHREGGGGSAFCLVQIAADICALEKRHIVLRGHYVLIRPLQNESKKNGAKPHAKKPAQQKVYHNYENDELGPNILSLAPELV